MKEVILNLIQETLKDEKIKLKKQEIENLIEIPPNFEMGDYAFPCFSLSKKLRMKPHEIALKFRANIKKLPKEISDIQASGPYLNFFLNKKILTKNLIKNLQKNKKTKQKIMIEFSSPNTNKPLHLGHLRNMAIGESISRILEFNGDKVFRTTLNNDRGIHICKSMAAYKKYGKNKTPNKKSDHFVGDFYIKFSKNKIQDKFAQELLQKWEQGDKETIELWNKMNSWALQGFEETYKKFGIKFDEQFYESQLYEKGKEIIQKGLKKGIFKKRKDGAVIINLEKEKLGKKVLLRSDGTSVYITQDLYLAKAKFEQYDLDNSIYVTGNEQDYHFDVLKTILQKLNFKFADKINHLSYGMVNLPEGKMKSREGTVVDADDLIEKVQNLVKKELNSREKLSKKELESRSLKIALASIKYFLLKTDIKKDMLFNPKESINFEGNTGPYLQYSYARASNILKKIKKTPKSYNIKLETKEKELIRKLSEFKEVISKSYQNLNPSLIAHYAYGLAKIFNEFYQVCPVINSNNELFRIKLVKIFQQTIKNSLYLLGIDSLEKM